MPNYRQLPTPTFLLHPNAGLPNEFGEYDETPEMMAAGTRRIGPKNGFLNIIGGCCGTLAAHIKAIVDAVQQISRLVLPSYSESLPLAGSRTL